MATQHDGKWRFDLPNPTREPGQVEAIIKLIEQAARPKGNAMIPTWATSNLAAGKHLAETTRELMKIVDHKTANRIWWNAEKEAREETPICTKAHVFETEVRYLQAKKISKILRPAQVAALVEALKGA